MIPLGRRGADRRAQKLVREREHPVMGVGASGRDGRPRGVDALDVRPLAATHEMQYSHAQRRWPEGLARPAAAHGGAWALGARVSAVDHPCRVGVEGLAALVIDVVA
jgi:hypothetical protein